LQKRNILITGAGSGIGAAAAYAEDGIRHNSRGLGKAIP